MSSIDKLLVVAFALFSFMLGMTIAYYDVAVEDPNPHYLIEHRALNYTSKDCYTKCDIDLIVFGKVLEHE